MNSRRFRILMLVNLSAVITVSHQIPGRRIIVVSRHERPIPTGLMPGQGFAHADFSYVKDIVGARDELRQWREKGNRSTATVYIRGGRYTLVEPLKFDQRDSNTTYEAYPGETPIIAGSSTVVCSKSGQPDDTCLTGPTSPTTQMFVEGVRAVRSRFPVSGFLQALGPNSTDGPYALHFRPNDDIKTSWSGTGAEAVILVAWAEARMRILSVDPASHTAILAGKPNQYKKETDARYWVENIPKPEYALGEWYQSPQTGRILFRTKWQKGPDGAIELEIPKLETLVQIQGNPSKGEYVHDLIIRGLHFEYTAWTLPSAGYDDSQGAVDIHAAIEAEAASRVTIDKCKFSNLGGYALSFAGPSNDVQITRNEITDVGAGGIKLGDGSQEHAQMYPSAGNNISDNEIHDLGRVFPAGLGIWLGQASNNTITHNHIYNLFQSGISVGWTWGYESNNCHDNHIEFNEIDHVGDGLLSDMGAIYTLGKQPGSVINGNNIHDVLAYKYGGWGIYLDEGSSDIRVTNNLVLRTSGGGFHQHYGRNNLVDNNIFGFSRDFQIARTRPGKDNTFTFTHNIVIFENGELLGGDWSGGATIDYNLYWRTNGKSPTFKGMDLAEWQKRGNDRNSIIEDPRFRDAEHNDFTIRNPSVASKVGFHEIKAQSFQVRNTELSPIP